MKKQRGVLHEFGIAPLYSRNNVIIGTHTVAIIETVDGRLETAQLSEVQFELANPSLQPPEPPQQRYDRRIPK
jgi:hypothetical protein